ncbi:MAG: HD domain-containing protein [Chloracidobacterium sp.]|nr:HD domain-containing protein [Chloracidobacterium sp.]
MKKSIQTGTDVHPPLRVQGIELKDRCQHNGAATIEDAITIAAQVHKGQTDKAGATYILHPLRIMMRMTSDAARITAVLHDVVEDSRDNPPETKWTLDRLRENGFTEEVVAAVDGVTDRKAEGEDYDAFIDRAGANPISRQVKIADLEDNMNMLRVAEIRPKDLERLEKYHRSWKKLTANTNNN